MPAHALAFGASLLVGPALTLPATVTATATNSRGQVTTDTVTFHPVAGPLGEVQLELGDRFISSFVGDLSTVPINADSNGVHATGRETLILAGYRFTFDLFGRSGKPPISPYVGLGTLGGLGSVAVSATNGGQTAVASGSKFTLEFDAVLGAHWRLNEHFGLRAEVGASTYGGVGAIEPRLGAYATF